MKEKRVKEIKELLSCKKNSPVTKLFYKYGKVPKIKLYSKRDILEELEINDSLNTLEYEGIIQLLSRTLAMIRKRAKSNLQPFVDYEITTTQNNNIALHGFTDDIAKIESNVAKYKSYVEQRKLIARQTEKIGKASIALLK